MKKLLLTGILLLLMLPGIVLAEENFVLTATIAAEESTLLRYPHAEASPVQTLAESDAVTVVTLGTVYCEVTCDGATGYVATADLAFDVLDGAEAQLAVVDVSPTNQYFGRITLREEAGKKSAALCRLARGCLVLVLGEEGDMCHLAIPGYQGYALKKYIDTSITQQAYELAFVANDDAVHLRLDSRYGENWVITRLAPGTPVQLISNPNGWALVEAFGHRARIVADYLTEEMPE